MFYHMCIIILGDNMKRYMVGFIAGIILMGTIGVVYAASSGAISFAPRDRNWSVSTVEGALNSLYDNVSTTGKINLSRFANNSEYLHYGLTSANASFAEAEGTWKINKSTLDNNFNTDGDFEISILVAVDNTQAGYMGGFKVSFMNSDSNVIDIMYRDGQGNSVYGTETIDFNGNTLHNVNGLTSSYLNSRYALVRRGNTISVYKDSALLATTEYAGTLSINKISLTFYKYGTYTPPTSLIKEIYLGDIKNYDN